MKKSKEWKKAYNSFMKKPIFWIYGIFSSIALVWGITTEIPIIAFICGTITAFTSIDLFVQVEKHMIKKGFTLGKDQPK